MRAGNIAQAQYIVIPAKAGIQSRFETQAEQSHWIPGSARCAAPERRQVIG
jgi:hypothetical protein